MTLINRPFFRSVLALLAAFSVGQVSAHSVWIETVEGKLVVRFGEVGEEYEKSPGYLDKLQLPVAVNGTKSAPVAVEKASEFFLLKDAALTEPTIVTTMFPVMEKPATAEKPASARWPQFYARWQVAAAAVKTVSALDIVPAAEAGKATVYFKGKPLPEAKLELIQPDGEEVELKADSEGVVKFSSKGKGLHVLLLAGHSETVNGTHDGKNYTVVSHNASLAWNE